jgi:hypothetical protein
MLPVVSFDFNPIPFSLASRLNRILIISLKVYTCSLIRIYHTLFVTIVLEVNFVYYNTVLPYGHNFLNYFSCNTSDNYYRNRNLLYKYPIRFTTNNFTSKSLNRVRSGFSKDEAAAIALLLGIEFPKNKFDLDEFWMGVNIELEHGKQSSLTNVTGDDPLLTGKIALAHLNEFPDYYKRLKVLEEEAKAYWNK